MTYDEIKAGIEKLVTSPDTAQADALELLKEVKTDYTTLDTLRTRAEDDAKRIRTLQDTNARLFLSQTSPEQHETEELTEDDGEDFINNFFDNLDNGGTEK